MSDCVEVIKKQKKNINNVLLDSSSKSAEPGDAVCGNRGGKFCEIGTLTAGSLILRGGLLAAMLLLL